MRLKNELRKQLEGNLESYKKQIEDTTNALQVLETTNLRKAIYKVSINSCWADYNEKSTVTTHAGSLEDAILKAESEFKDTNQRSDVQAGYSVQIVLGPHECPLPESYWKQYTQNWKQYTQKYRK